jgi:hypothetical protein
VNIRSENVRIPLSARQALARHETVVVLSHGRPVYELNNSEDHARETTRPRGIPGRELIALLRRMPPLDEDFVRDMEAVRASVGPVPKDPWEPS